MLNQPNPLPPNPKSGSALSVAEADERLVSESTLSWIKENLTWEIEDRFLEDVPEGDDPWEDIAGMHPTLKVMLYTGLGLGVSG